MQPARLKGKICLLRLDFNTADDWRMEASLPTVKFLHKHCQALVILSHKGRPDGIEESLSLRPESKKLSEALKKEVTFIHHFNLQEIGTQIRSAPKKSAFLLENLRFLPEETKGSAYFAKSLAELGDMYVNDAFAVSHRNDASVAGIAEFLPSFAGFELEKEIKNLSKAIKQPKKPLVVIMGGSKIENKLSVFKNLKPKASLFLLGGLLNDTILKMKDKKLLLPVDLVRDGGDIKDIGPQTAILFAKAVAKAKTIIWNGPVGDIEMEKYSLGSRAIAKAVTANKAAFIIVGGGETVMFLKRIGASKKIDFISTGGGAMLDFLSGKKLPGITALEKAKLTLR